LFVYFRLTIATTTTTATATRIVNQHEFPVYFSGQLTIKRKKLIIFRFIYKNFFLSSYPSGSCFTFPLTKSLLSLSLSVRVVKFPFSVSICLFCLIGELVSALDCQRRRKTLTKQANKRKRERANELK
jgi:hypothetical protein